jgi:uncharacterized protein YndB with AHSA1/START domain
MTRKHHGRVIETSIRIKTSPQQAWEAWADPQQIANWFVDRAEGEAKAGSTMKWFFEAFNYALDVPIVEAEPGRTFVTGGGPQPGPDGLPYLMEITIEKNGDATVMNLVNSGFSEAPEKKGSFRDTESGWKCALQTLKVWLERYPALRRRRTIVMRPAQHSPERLRTLYATAEGRRQWLAPDIPADGEMLIDTGTEVMLDWPSERALLGLKSFEMGPQQMVALDLSVWSTFAPGASGQAPGAAADREARLTRALDRLVKLL